MSSEGGRPPLPGAHNTYLGVTYLPRSSSRGQVPGERRRSVLSPTLCFPHSVLSHMKSIYGKYLLLWFKPTNWTVTLSLLGWMSIYWQCQQLYLVKNVVPLLFGGDLEQPVQTLGRLVDQ